jgi:threonine/homoserine/homoserine lactone efflux protein
VKLHVLHALLLALPFCIACALRATVLRRWLRDVPRRERW